VRIDDRFLVRSRCGIIAAALLLGLAGSIGPAAAGGLFETLFGSFGRSSPPPAAPAAQASSYADPLGFLGSRHSGGESSFGHGTVFCVRTCDGRYFPLQRLAGASPAETCRSFCPASRTMVFSGSKIDTAVAPNGTRYADLDSAFAYRDKLVNNCTCTGRKGGLAHLDTNSDPTLRSGDIVATNSGFATFTGKTAEFTPVNPSSSALARQLTETKVRPAPPEQKIEPVASNDTVPVLKGRAQAAR
jgi:hypothetical protein